MDEFIELMEGIKKEPEDYLGDHDYNSVQIFGQYLHAYIMGRRMRSPKWPADELVKKIKEEAEPRKLLQYEDLGEAIDTVIKAARQCT